MVWSYRAADPGIWLHFPSAEAKTFAVLAMPVPLFLLVGRLTTPAKTAEPAGIYRITAVPGSLSVLLWTLLHLAALGEARQVIIFTGMAAISLFSLVKNWRTASPGPPPSRHPAVRRYRPGAAALRLERDRLEPAAYDRSPCGRRCCCFTRS